MILTTVINNCSLQRKMQCKMVFIFALKNGQAFKSSQTHRLHALGQSIFDPIGQWVDA